VRFHRLYLALAIAWFLAAAFVFIEQTRTGDPRCFVRLFGSEISYGWFALILSAYNGLRWWARRSEAERGRLEEAMKRRRRARGDDDERPEPLAEGPNNPL
jgi:hypothetical protein